ncbi:hypothetical protein PHYBLDRAFT_68690 [Phycomyces blakesleeanus NRRL 1555(-)]|uniref:Uncharacterized protein n=1 Tax=Phycomyces blakesleeanus (strain ATCC 8743b / DSM 1359 / FGSC 10004 / NBRC 33097 / NRRL 1555) TaxID=763407 RepID=A0A163A9Z5_PHYB8|nr:hypothetical protein PHYBLDRAFT_68690 [Phycomyces blakesleeanus NRRL 1555(-)]OAD72041.1 hypothetical protein PHYBLDRAFT_68690 [Phycomyces blakesleeanus NRRL 1555(-)]|eukprot:XP_018290081.1 hypothetical protein PHYBLDRAFT_68690 [Phycomyces blakesleeanus NRRL 1555(-)]
MFTYSLLSSRTSLSSSSSLPSSPSATPPSSSASSASWSLPTVAPDAVPFMASHRSVSSGETYSTTLSIPDSGYFSWSEGLGVGQIDESSLSGVELSSDGEDEVWSASSATLREEEGEEGEDEDEEEGEGEGEEEPPVGNRSLSDFTLAWLQSLESFSAEVDETQSLSSLSHVRRRDEFNEDSDEEYRPCKRRRSI